MIEIVTDREGKKVSISLEGGALVFRQIGNEGNEVRLAIECTEAIRRLLASALRVQS